VTSTVPLLLLSALLGAAPATPAKKHAFKVVYEDTTKPELQPIAAKMKEKRVLEGAAVMLGALKLPKTLTLKGMSCGESNAWYDSETDIITFCYELVSDFIKQAGKSGKFNLTPEQAVVGPFLFIVLHETAHAVFGVLAVPVLGREEDAADQVATYAAIQLGGEFAERMLRAAAFMYDQDSAVRKPGEDDFADVHGLDRQRFYNVLCLAWGSDPTRYSFAKDLGKLPEDRAEGCADEYKQVRYAVRTLIRKHVDQKEVAEIKAKASRSKFAR
jgi:Putative metallopeptidase